MMKQTQVASQGVVGLGCGLVLRWPHHSRSPFGFCSFPQNALSLFPATEDCQASNLNGASGTVVQPSPGWKSTRSMHEAKHAALGLLNDIRFTSIKFPPAFKMRPSRFRKQILDNFFRLFPTLALREGLSCVDSCTYNHHETTTC